MEYLSKPNDEGKEGACPDCGRVIPEEAPSGLCPKCLLSEAALGSETLSGIGEVSTATGNGGRLESPTVEEMAAAFPGLEVEEQIGEGGMGVVYKARQRRLDRWVALKLLRCPPEQEAHFAERFLREARALAKLNHPHIVTVHDFGEASGYFYLLMEYVDGVNLRQAMKAAALSPEEALRIVPVVCEALQYAHEQGVLHRDIKPANILLTREGDVKMVDFGLAKFVNEPRADGSDDSEDEGEMLTQTEAALGTPAYMAPEQTTDPSRVDHRADIYSLGVVFYEMLTGDLPLGRFPVPSKTSSSLDARVDEVVLRTLEREPDERYQSAGDMKTDVEELTQDRGPRREGVAPEQRTKVRVGTVGMVAQPSGGRFVWQALVGSLLVLASVLAAVMATAFIDEGQEMVGLVLSLAVLLFGVVGTALGWIGANRIRMAPNQHDGMPIAALAALAWPVLLLIGLYLFTFEVYFRSTPIWIKCALSVPVVLYFVWRDFEKWQRHEPTSLRYAWALVALFLGLFAFDWLKDARRTPTDIPTAERQMNDVVAKALMDGADVDVRMPGGNEETALMRVARGGNVNQLRQLLDQSAQVDLRAKDGRTAFLIAAEAGWSDILKGLLEHGADIHATLPGDEMSALHLAARGGHTPTAKFLMDHGLSITARDGQGRTPLMWAVIANQNQWVNHLVSFSGNRVGWELVDAEGWTVLDHALMRGNIGLGRELLKRGAEETAGWNVFEAFYLRNTGWEKVVVNLQQGLKALQKYPVKHLQFRMDRWHYTVNHPNVAICAMAVEAAALAGDGQVATDAQRLCEDYWPEGLESLVLIERRDRAPGNAGSQSLTVQSFALRLADVGHPLQSEMREAVLNGKSVTTRPTGEIVEHPLESTTFFR